MDLNKLTLIYIIIVQTFIGIFSQMHRNREHTRTRVNGIDNDELSELALLRKLLLRIKERERPTSSPVSMTRNQKERPPINLNIIVVPVVHQSENESGRERKGKLTASSDESMTKQTKNRFSFPEKDDDTDLDTQESSYFVNSDDRESPSTPASGIHPGPTVRPCTQNEVYDRHLGQCIRRGGLIPPIRGRRRQVGR